MFGNETSQEKHSMAICHPLHESAQPALFSGPTPSFPSLESEAGTSRWGDILSWQGTFDPRTTCPGGQLVQGGGHVVLLQDNPSSRIFDVWISEVPLYRILVTNNFSPEIGNT